MYAVHWQRNENSNIPEFLNSFLNKADLGENIDETAEREILEETGVKSSK